MFGYLSANVLSEPRGLFAMSRDGFLPRMLSSVHPNFQSPHKAIMIYGVIVASIALSGTYETLTIFANLSALKRIRLRLDIWERTIRRFEAPHVFAFTLGWQSNIFALLRGDFLQNRVAALDRERQQLLAAMEQRQQRIAALELEINRYEAQNLLELEQRRAQAEAELAAEREALRRLEERLRRIEQQQQPAPPPR